MRKNDLDGKIRDYFFWNFKEIVSPEVARDFRAERIIGEIGKAEELLKKNIDLYFPKRIVKIPNLGEFYIGNKNSLQNSNKQFIHKFIDEKLKEKFGLDKLGALLPSLKFFDLWHRMYPDNSIEKSVDAIIGDIKDTVGINDIYSIPQKPIINIDINRYDMKTESGILEYISFIRYDLGDKKVIVPLGIFRKLVFLLSIWEAKVTPLINANKRHSKYPCVIMTPCLETLCYNEKRKGIDIVPCNWVSWYGDENKISDKDLEQLQDKRIYYLLKLDSGLSKEKVCGIGESVRERLLKLGIKDFKYISYLHHGIINAEKDYQKVIPRIYNPDQLQEALNENGKIEVMLPQNNNSKSKKLMLPPFIYEESATFIYGDSYSGKTLFALNLASSTAFQISLFSRRIILSDVKPIICYMSSDSSQDKMLSLFNNSALKLYAEENSDVDEHYSIFRQIKNRNSHSVINEIESIDLCGRPGVVFLDNVLPMDTKSQEEHDLIIRKIKSLGWAIVILTKGKMTSKKKNSYLKIAPFDNVVQIKKNVNKNPVDAKKIRMYVEIKKAIKLPAEYAKKFMCEVDLNTEFPKIVRCRSRRKKRAKSLTIKEKNALKTEMRILVNKKCTGLKIAQKLGIKRGMVEKLKREMGLSKPRKNLDYTG